MGFQSIQERVVHAFAERSMSSCLIFVPDKYDNGSKERCDLVYASHDAVVFMNMTAQETISDDFAQNVRKRDKMIQHNLGPARGLIKAFRGGAVITGRNSTGEFSVSHTPGMRVAVLSIIRGPEAVVTRHRDKEVELQIDLCATLPEETIDAAVHEGWMLPDFIHFAANSTASLTISGSIAAIHAYTVACHKTAGTPRHWPKEWDKNYRMLRRCLLALRTKMNVDVAYVMADMSLVEFHSLIVHIHTAACGAVAGDCTYSDTLQTSHYDFTISVMPHIFVGKYFDQLTKHSERLDMGWKNGRVRWGPHIVLIAASYSPLFIIIPSTPPPPTLAARLLQMAAEGR